MPFPATDDIAAIMPMLERLAAHIRARRLAYERGFEAELTKLRAVYGMPAVEEALTLASVPPLDDARDQAVPSVGSSSSVRSASSSV